MFLKQKKFEDFSGRLSPQARILYPARGPHPAARTNPSPHCPSPRTQPDPQNPGPEFIFRGKENIENFREKRRQY